MSFSYSQLRAYALCPRQYEYAFVKKLKAPPTPESCFGVAMHGTLARWGALEMQRLESGKGRGTNAQIPLFFPETLPSSPQLLTPHTLIDLWHRCFIVNAYATKAEADFDRARGEALLREFFTWWAREPRRVIAVEKGFAVEIEKGDTLIITGRFDRVEELPDGRLRIIDFKTGDTRSQKSVDQDFQLSLYALAARETFGKEVRELVMLFLGDAFTEVKTVRTEGELSAAAHTVTLLAGRIAGKDYHPTPSIKVCRNCPYRRICDVAAA